MRYELNIVNKGGIDRRCAPPSGGASNAPRKRIHQVKHAPAQLTLWWLRLCLPFPSLSPCMMSSSGSTSTTVTPPTSASGSAGTGTITLLEEDLTTLIQTAVCRELAVISSASSSSTSPSLPPAPIPSTAATGMPIFPFLLRLYSPCTHHHGYHCKHGATSHSMSNVHTTT